MKMQHLLVEGYCDGTISEKFDSTQITLYDNRFLHI